MLMFIMVLPVMVFPAIMFMLMFMLVLVMMIAVIVIIMVIAVILVVMVLPRLALHDYDPFPDPTLGIQFYVPSTITFLDSDSKATGSANSVYAYNLLNGILLKTTVQGLDYRYGQIAFVYFLLAVSRA